MKHLIILFSIILLLCSCEAKNDISYINVAVSQEPVTTDVMVNTSLTGRLILVGSVYERLVVLDGEGNIKPELASSFTLSDDGRTLSFEIREGSLLSAALANLRSSQTRKDRRRNAAEQTLIRLRFSNRLPFLMSKAAGGYDISTSSLSLKNRDIHHIADTATST